jgi:hypothetical protein
MIIAVASGKGGTGKAAIATSLRGSSNSRTGCGWRHGLSCLRPPIVPIAVVIRRRNRPQPFRQQPTLGMTLDTAGMRPRWQHSNGEMDSGGVRVQCAAEREGIRGQSVGSARPRDGSR